jgi:hypothetical protein
MATGDIRWFSRGLLDLGKKLHDLSSDTFKVGLITSAATPVIGSADPRWGAGGTTNFATNQVTPGGNYSTGGPSLATVTWTEVSNVPTFRANDVTITQNAGNPTNARWGIIYNDTDAGKRAIGFIDFGSDRNLTTGDFTINFGGSGTDVLTITQSA